MKRTDRHLPDRRFVLCAVVFALLFIVAAGVLIGKSAAFFTRFSYELRTPFTWDTTIYYAIGKGMTHGLIPYRDLFETKPPMIFYMVAISYALTGEFYLCNILSFALLLTTSLFPLGYGIFLFRKKRVKQPLLAFAYFLALVFSGWLFAGYDQIRSGEVQVELFGAGFTLLYFFIIATEDATRLKPYSPSVLFSSLAVMIAVMYKEPFLVIAVTGALMVSHTRREFLMKLFLPLLYGGALGLLLLAATGCLVPYVTLYLPHMLGNHIEIYGSPFQRMWNFPKLVSDLTAYSPFLFCLVLMSFLVSAWYILKEPYESSGAGKEILHWLCAGVRILLPLLASSFAVGLGGQYYNHHFIFALPLYMLFLMISLRWAIERIPAGSDLFSVSKESLLFPATVFLIAASGLVCLPEFQYNETILSLSQSMIEDARYVDDIMDLIQRDRYQYFGFNGPIFYAYTEHDPMGPVFFQDPNNFTDEDNFFAESLKRQMEETDLYIWHYNSCGVLSEYVSDYIREKFTIFPPLQEIASLQRPESFHYTVYYRIGAF